MAKKGVFKITGNSSPKTGEKTLYKVTDWYPATPSSQRKESLVTWELFRKREDGKFTTTNIRKKGTGEFTFGKDAYKYIYQIEGYLHSPEGHEPMAMIVKPQKNEQQPAPKEKDILGVKLTYQDGSPVNKTLSYMDRLRATAKCQALEGEYITFSVWEDDEEKSGHHKNNQFILKSSPLQVDSKGYARWNFTLLNTYISLANKREDDKKHHEYYVTAEYNGKPETSGNVNVTNPEYKVPASTPKKPAAASVPEKTKPKPAKPKQQPKPDTPKGSTNSGSQNNQPDKKGIIKSIKLVDKNGKAFTKKPKFGEDIKLIIEAKDVVGKKYTLKLWEHDNTGDNDLVYNNTHTFKAERQEVVISLNPEMQKIGETGKDPKNPDSGEYWTGNWQEIFAEVIFLNISTKSSTIDVGIKEVPKKQDDGKSPAKKEKKDLKNDSVCLCKQYDLIWGAKVNCDFRKKVVEISKDLWGEANKIKMANYLMAIFKWESGGTFKPDVPNQANSGGTGLIQFLPSTAKILLGHEVTIELVKNYHGQKYNKKTKQKEDWYLKRVKEFANMTAIRQLDYVKEYLKDLKGKNLEFVDMYLRVLFPVSSGLPDHVVFANNLSKLDRPTETEKLKNKRVDAYNGNKGLDINGDGKIMKSEIKTKVQPYITEGLVNKENKFECGNKEESTKKTDLAGKCLEGNIVGGFIENKLVTKNKIDSCNKNSMPSEVKIIVLHRTAGGKAAGTLSHMKTEGYGAHFVVDYDGTVYQTIGLDKKGSHMGVRPYAATVEAGWGNKNSIGIETCGYSYDKDGNKRVGAKYDKIPHHHWETVTDAQSKSIACLLKFLLNHFSLDLDDVKVHEKLCQKEPNEGQDVYNAMLPYFNKKDE
ncbi:N-acetylmuramoyl-L-alanine amidase [Chryseobacterium herbae]|uniref:N-acetylmuramoyl-L-alanine amidase n=1 Tax=Chryseobacterium herbae TaxID=2976476 RepID=A0ABT2IQE7_9FLAO|nr:N-acetylmuramoyl-L-alanine amidase [Chryseobacterium sp. pc1-10]MCT2560900.1 N-acetylmuramoyl-L-alanine amidase [Chryseobacterium sp. pc1-10]